MPSRLITRLLSVTAIAGALLTGAAFTFADHHQEGEKKDDSAKMEKSEKKAIPAKWTFLGSEGLPAEMKSKIKSELMPMVGKPAPELVLTDFRNAKPISNDDLKGKITIVDIWATWCGPCISAIPHNNELQAKYADKGVQFLGVTTSSGQENLDKVMDQHKIEYAVAKDPDQKTLQAWKAFFFPTYFAVDREGVVRGVALNPGNLEDVIKMLLEEQPAAEQQASAAE